MKIMEKAKRFFTLNAANHEGFTLVELIVVIAILAILAGVAVPAYSGYVEKAKKANDLTLLGAVNDAFAAACMENGTDVYSIPGATAKIEGGLITEITYKEAFDFYFAGNENTKFEVIERIVFDKNVHAFVEMNSAYQAMFDALLNDPAMAGSIGAFKGSAFAAMGAEALLGQVSDVSALASLLIQSVDADGNPSALTSIVMSESYRETMAELLGYPDGDAYFAAVQDMMNEDPQKAADFMANSTVLNVATTMNGWDAEKEQAAKNDLMGLDFGNLAAKINNPETAEDGLAQAALLYGMYTAFDPEGAANLLKGDDAGLGSLANLGDKTNADGKTFEAYLAELNDSNSQAAKDYEGYVGALDVVNQGVSSDQTVANQVMNGGYNDSTLSALLQQVIDK